GQVCLLHGPVSTLAPHDGGLHSFPPRRSSDLVEEAVVRAIMHAESAFNPNALSRAGAQGLMQLMPATARRFGVVNAYDPSQNIQDRKSTRLNSSHVKTSYAGFRLKKKTLHAQL